MDDLISRQAAIDAVDAIGHIATMPDGDKCIRRSAVKYTLSMLPSAQPIIRCRDCKNFGGGTYCYERDGLWGENDFCSYADRKGEEDEDE